MRKTFTVFTLLVVLSLIVFGTIEAKNARFQKAPRLVADQNSSTRVSKQSPNQTAAIQEANTTAIFVCNQWNAYSSQASYSNQISFDPYSRYVAVCHRADHTVTGGSGRIMYNVSDDGGANWTAQIGPVNPTTLPAWYDANQGRHPSLGLTNPTHSEPIVSVAYNNLYGGAFGHVVYSQDAGFDGVVDAAGRDTTSVYNCAIATNIADGTLYSLWNDPGDDFNNLYLAKSTDAGATWTKTKIFDHSEGEGTDGLNGGWIDIDNAQTIHVVFEGKMRAAPDTESYYFRYQSSTDAGATWSTPEYVGSGLVGYNTVNYQFDCVVDANKTLHIGTVMTDTVAEPDVPSLFDITRTVGGTWSYTKITDLQTEVFYLTEVQDLWTLNEPHFAKTTDDQLISLSWIDMIAQGTVADTLADVFVVAKNASDVSWGGITNITNTQAVNEVMTKGPRYIDEIANNSMLILYTLFGPTDLDEAAYYILIQPIITGVDDEPGARISAFSLKQNYPNPFNPSTEIKYYLNNPSMVTLKVYNIIGQEVATLVNTKMGAGEHTARFNAAGLTSGVYLYKLQAGTFSDVKKMVILK